MVDCSIKQALDRATGTLSDASVEVPRLTAEVLLSHVLGWERTRLYIYCQESLTKKDWNRLQALLKRRLAGEPLAYIVGHKEFYGLDLAVDRHVLIPRPETEILVEEALKAAERMIEAHSGGGQPVRLVIADVGTGSGAIAIAIAVNLSFRKGIDLAIYASDISAGALEVAQANAARHNVQKIIRFLQGDLLQPLPQPVDLILANLPYVPAEEVPALERHIAEYEPSSALAAEEGGLRYYRGLLADAPRRLNPGGQIFMEIDPRQAAPLRELAGKTFPRSRVTILKDLAGRDRVLRVETG